MIRKPHRLDEYVRQATQLDDDKAAALADPTAEQALSEEITRMDTSDQPASPRKPTRRRIQLAAIAAGIATITLAVLASNGVIGTRNQPPTAAANPTQASEPTQSPERQGDVFGTGMASSCVEEYSPKTVTGRAFAFDGRVVNIAERRSGNDEADPYVPVTFTVSRWFRGGHGDQITVAMFPPEAHTTVDNASYAVGSRLLVSGEDRWGSSLLDNPIAWACGFTRWYNQADAQVWEQAFR